MQRWFLMKQCPPWEHSPSAMAAWGGECPRFTDCGLSGTGGAQEGFSPASSFSRGVSRGETTVPSATGMQGSWGAPLGWRKGPSQGSLSPRPPLHSPPFCLQWGPHPLVSSSASAGSVYLFFNGGRKKKPLANWKFKTLPIWLSLIKCIIHEPLYLKPLHF